ncbi:hypothetical protein L226DRAFT_173755 [Lentinus tigrinus ALCF2SS1-7]|uniref:uncharacterized protein n=1 Tax=Lentinus tigrinus ALCF2SS1-7 TaxID=1328758 RepID=UPI001165DF6A|nr:hypothetical protein L226DRAFT_173755 [Lentinus tigrinus ALCF2SS1-7]
MHRHPSSFPCTQLQAAHGDSSRLDSAKRGREGGRACLTAAMTRLLGLLPASGIQRRGPRAKGPRNEPPQTPGGALPTARRRDGETAKEKEQEKADFKLQRRSGVHVGSTVHHTATVYSFRASSSCTPTAELRASCTQHWRAGCSCCGRHNT